MGSEGTVLLTEEPSGLAARTIADHLAHWECSPDTSALALLDTETHESPTSEPVMTAYIDVAKAGEAAARAFKPVATLADGRLVFVLVDPSGEPVIVRPDPSVGVAELPPTEDDPKRAVMIDWIYLATTALWADKPKMVSNFLGTYLRRGRVGMLSDLSTDDLLVVVDGVERALSSHQRVEFGIPRP